MAGLPVLSCAAAVAAASLVAGVAWGRDAPRAAASSSLGEAIESCVDRTTVRFRGGEHRALLDTADSAMVAAALVRRYPIVEQQGLTPQRVAVWRKPETGWVYAALLVDPAKPGDFCFTATFSASRFDVTPSMLEKYFGIAQASD
jgi:hypothetical protein